MSEQPVFVANPDSAVQVFDLRDLLAVHAPDDVAYWFQPTVETKRPEAIYPPRPDGPAAFHVRMPTNENEINDWDRAYSIARLAQWPWFYADLVLAARKPQP